MVSKQEIASHICDKLRQVIQADRVALTALFESRVPCNSLVESDSPAVPWVDDNKKLWLGTIGILSALITPEYRIVVEYDDDDQVIDVNFVCTQK